jgi:hypothetical protein
MICQTCESKRIMRFMAYCRNHFTATLSNVDYQGYVPPGPWGSGDDFEGYLCLDCGQFQGEWPCETPEILKRDE